MFKHQGEATADRRLEALAAENHQKALGVMCRQESLVVCKHRGAGEAESHEEVAEVRKSQQKATMEPHLEPVKVNNCYP